MRQEAVDPTGASRAGHEPARLRIDRNVQGAAGHLRASQRQLQDIRAQPDSFERDGRGLPALAFGEQFEKLPLDETAEQQLAMTESQQTFCDGAPVSVGPRVTFRAAELGIAFRQSAGVEARLEQSGHVFAVRADLDWR